ncbi:glycosyltransferase family 9 protein [Bordetella bronchialis]|uniref:Glycosyl transferase n=1 Tax=Bordetella bronchialis TaxID=463025 RepID=A0A193G091_9BORD|nr:glycosyltransferase family 9 protein [Bordetella bronchialis]ANN68152.1 hypothetical protein BAU06_19260 [Bordetella bronchialis]ANN73285.1 hypothetical protein BAU08_19760 [Bordetella bronchialis]
MIEGHSVNQGGSIALILSARLGDTLFLMNVANNLRRAGRDVVIYGTHGHDLAGWFPGFDIRPLPSESEIGVLEKYAAIVQMDQDKPIAGLGQRYPQYAAIKSWPGVEDASSRKRHPRGHGGRHGEFHHGHIRYNGVMIRFRYYTQARFGLTEWVPDTGLRPPGHLRARVHARRIVIHPTSSEQARCWKPSQYVALATELRARGFEPTFVLAPNERPAWRALLAPHGLPILEAPDLARTAAAIYESGWFIGTDSGIGHLASACGVPTVTIVDRPRNMNSWRPMWAPGLIVRPWWLPLRQLRRKYWREATTVGRVLRTFDKLRQRVGGARHDKAPPARRP